MASKKYHANIFADKGGSMEKLEFQIDEQTLARALKLAASRHCTLGDLIKQIIEQLGQVETENDPILGMFTDEPELMDQVMESAMAVRELHPLRQSNE